MNSTYDSNVMERIRPYRDEEVTEVIRTLLADNEFVSVVKSLFPPKGEALLEKLPDVHSVLAFKRYIVAPVLSAIVRQSAFSIDLSGKKRMGGDVPATFITNHRDIILDSALLNLLLDEAKFRLPRIAIGDNLLLRPWIKSVVRLSDAAIVERSLPPKEFLASANAFSAFLMHSITKDEASFWIAQREGRAKNNEDTTQPAILKMMSLAGDGTPIERLRRLNLVPVSVSYEFDPCDYLKAKELLVRAANGSYQKAQDEDLISMRQGLTGQKGRIHFTIGTPVNKYYDTGVCNNLTANELFRTTAAYIDNQIHAHYRLYPNNFIAEDLLQNSGYNYGEGQYSDRERTDFEDYLTQRIALAALPDEQEPLLRRTLLSMYARPLINYRMACHDADQYKPI